MVSSVYTWIVFLLVLGQAWTTPVSLLDAESRARSVVSDLGQRLVSHSRLQDSSAAGVDPRLPLPTPQELESIKKVAQILIMLGEQVIPSILGDNTSTLPHATTSNTIPIAEVPNDPVNDQ